MLISLLSNRDPKSRRDASKGNSSRSERAWTTAVKRYRTRHHLFCMRLEAYWFCLKPSTCSHFFSKFVCRAGITRYMGFLFLLLRRIPQAEDRQTGRSDGLVDFKSSTACLTPAV
ncbi:unnamed protein product, partial [Ectocarpus fasciculatus]